MSTVDKRGYPGTSNNIPVIFHDKIRVARFAVSLEHMVKFGVGIGRTGLGNIVLLKDAADDPGHIMVILLPDFTDVDRVHNYRVSAYFCFVDHENFMRRCLQLAQNGLGTTYPNPLVGSVIVCKDKIIGEGWHRKAGSPHAEVNAIASVRDPELLSQSTIYVSLEPCGHFGRTPPCANLIIEKKIPRVVVGCKDPNPEVAGNGIKRLRDAGIEVIIDILEAECREINRRFFTNQLAKRPFVILKWAESADGFLSPNKKQEQSPHYISGVLSRRLVHKWRTEEDGILVGAQTIKDDDPRLDARNWNGGDPVKIVLDRSGRVDRNSRIFAEGKNIVFSKELREHHRENIIFETDSFKGRYLKRILERLYILGICSIIVEGGKTTLEAFIDEDLWDEARVFKGNAQLGAGTERPKFHGIAPQVSIVDGDRLSIFRNL